uniref:Reprolysin n=1 Tax=Rhipicephalus appendiculatus TaxID=34631 RepID=A0A131YWQ6_RHIAP
MKLLIQVLICFLLQLQRNDCEKLTAKESIVFPKLIQSREEDGTKVLRINEDLTLNLQKSSILSRNFLVRTYEDNITQHIFRDGELLEQDLYHDPRTFASVMVSEENGLRVEGVLGPRLRIKPRMDDETSSEDLVAHVLYENDDTSHEGESYGIKFEEPTDISERQDNQGAASGGDTAEIVYPEILVAVDSTLRSQFSSVETLLRYVIVTVNSANIRYTTVKNPTVQLKLCALEIFTEYKEVFLYRVQNYLAGVRTLQFFYQYVEQYQYKYDRYDAVYLLTGLDMAGFKGNSWDATLKGLAYVGGACTVRKVGMSEDKAGTFVGVRPFAHEFGHLLGCPHDGDKFGEFSSEECPWNDGFLMSYLVRDSRSMRFSRCCNNMIRKHVRSVEGRCLLTRITATTITKGNFTKKLPGDYIRQTNVCQLTFPEVKETYLIKDKKKRCQGRCYFPEYIWRVGFKDTVFPDNFPCRENNGKYCINGQCVHSKLKYDVYRTSE